MSSYKKYVIEGCCGKASKVICELDFVILPQHLDILKSAGFSISKSYLNNGMLMAQTIDFAIISYFGSNILQFKYKNSAIQDIDRDMESVCQILTVDCNDIKIKKTSNRI